MPGAPETSLEIFSSPSAGSGSAAETLAAVANIGAATTVQLDEKRNVFQEATATQNGTLTFDGFAAGVLTSVLLQLHATGADRTVTINPGGYEVVVPSGGYVNAVAFSTDGTDFELSVWGTGLTIQDEGVALAAEDTLDFAGAGVTVTNGAGKNLVTIPGGAATPLYCRLTHSASQTPGADAAITFDTESSDQGGLHSAGTNPTRITIPADGDGFYTLTACIDDAGTSGTRGIYFKKNGTTELARADVNSTNGRGALTTAAHLVATDYIELFYGGTFAIDATAERSPIFTAARVG